MPDTSHLKRQPRWWRKDEYRKRLTYAVELIEKADDTLDWAKEAGDFIDMMREDGWTDDPA